MHLALLTILNFN